MPVRHFSGEEIGLLRRPSIGRLRPRLLAIHFRRADDRRSPRAAVFPPSSIKPRVAKRAYLITQRPTHLTWSHHELSSGNESW